MSEMPFIHEDHCRFQDLQPEWQSDARMGVERRQCMCGAETRPLTAWQIDPATQSPEPSKSAALHFPGCATVADAVTVERNNIDGGWQALCGLCGCKTLFWHETVWDIPERGDAVLVTRAGNALYSYRTADEDRREQQRQQRRE